MRFTPALALIHLEAVFPSSAWELPRTGGDTSSIRSGASADRGCFPHKTGRAPRWDWSSSLLCIGLPTSLSRERIQEPRESPPHHIPLPWGSLHTSTSSVPPPRHRSTSQLLESRRAGMQLARMLAPYTQPLFNECAPMSTLPTCPSLCQLPRLLLHGGLSPSHQGFSVAKST